MNRTIANVATEIGVTVEDLTVWIERRWVLPARQGKEWAFDAADRARIRMIMDFHEDLAIDDEVMPVVLNLIDRLHAARAELRGVLAAIAELPELEQDSILRVIRANKGEAKR
jgi:chaperone modulatory protein CbpM